MKLFDKVLVANRGEIAVRVLRALRELGIASVAVYSDADRDALHVRMADEAWCIGGQLPGESYLLGEKIIDVARKSGAQAVHPGYGFLAENAGFARDCEAAGIVFIGPTPDAIDSMGSKTASRELMRDAGVSIVPGSTEPLTTLDAVRTVADEVGYPVAVKARSGGGGKGFRVALTADDLESAFEGASREGERYFADAAVYLERYLHDPRHVEVQILGDSHGTIIHLGERDCTIQRRHQKLVEESPCPVADETLRDRLAVIALGAARAVDYRSAGTVECLLDSKTGEAYFLEMNTRVQVEHTVTEQVTGIDIVAEQIKIAAGAPLSISQGDVELRGCAIEVRINAEDARHDFRPSSGPISHYREPGGIGVRVDSGVEAGSEITPFYDTMVAKLIAWGPDRAAATARLLRALDEFEVEGIETLVEFHKVLIASPQFAAFESCRELVEHPADFLPPIVDPASHNGAAAAPPRVRAREDLVVEVEGRRYDVAVFDAPGVTPAPPPIRRQGASGAGAAGDVLAPIPGNVLQVLVAEGATVEAGDMLCILEAMKMENEIVAPAAGTVARIAVAPGDAVAAGALLLHIEE